MKALNKILILTAVFALTGISTVSFAEDSKLGAMTADSKPCPADVQALGDKAPAEHHGPKLDADGKPMKDSQGKVLE